MGYRGGIAAAGFGIALAACGAVGVAAWLHGMWGLLTGTALAAGWLVVLLWWLVAHAAAPVAVAVPDDDAGDAMVLRLLLDAAPTPLLAVDGGAVRALNRAARAMFATDDRVLPPPDAVKSPDASHLRHEGGHWRIDRVAIAGTGRTVVALIDIEQEERVAEARATADLIQVLGHELLNGLAPIVSLAESGLAAARPGGPAALLPEILGTLARRAEGLRRFTEGYRALARLPEPLLRPVAVAELAGDLARLFAGRWPAVPLAVTVAAGTATVDRDQLSQAIWAVLQNAAEAATDAAGPPRVTLAVRSDGGGWIVEVSDSGAGVAPSAAARIFRPFHTTRAEGTGIGLSLARQIALAHGGTLSLLPVRPTTFRFVLPMRRG